MLDCILVGAGGFIGTVLRYLIGLIPLKTESGFPIKTLVINVAGAFLIGLITALALKDRSLNRHLELMLRVGVCGGFTTFSTFAYENYGLLQDGHGWLSFLYVLLSIVLGILAIYASRFIIR
jgi:CrcB protein